MSPVTKVVTLDTPGTPVRLSTDTNLAVSGLLVYADGDNTGTVYLGTSAVDPATLAGVIRKLEGAEDFQLSGQGSNRIYPADYYLDVTVAGQKVIVTFWAI